MAVTCIAEVVSAFFRGVEVEERADFVPEGVDGSFGGFAQARHGRYITFQLAEVAIPRALFTMILRLIDGLRPSNWEYRFKVFRWRLRFDSRTLASGKGTMDLGD